MATTGSFITSLVTSFVIFCILLIVYAILSRRPGNAVIYYPLRILRGEDGPAVVKRRGMFSWVLDSFKASEDDIVAVAGLDAAVYMHLFTAALEIVVLSALFCMPVLIPLSATSNYNQQQSRMDPNFTYSNFDNLGMGNVEPNNSKIWAFLLAMFWVSFVVYYVLFKAYRRIVHMRDRAQASAYARPQQYTALVRDIPKTVGKESRIQQVDSFFARVHPGAYNRVQPVYDIKPAEKIFKEREEALRKLEHAEGVWEMSKLKSGNAEGTRPMHKTGFMGLLGPKVDSIEYWRAKSQELNPQVDTVQRTTRQEKGQDAAFVMFNDRRSAAEASQVLHAPHALRWRVTQAPEPEEIVWHNLHIPAWQRAVRRFIVGVLTFFLIVFYMIPIAFVASLTTLENLAKILPFIRSITKIGVLGNIIQAYLPQLALLVFLALLPTILITLSRLEGFPSQSQIVRAASAKYFYFIIFNVFLGVTLFGAVFSNIASVNVLIDQSNLSVAKVVQLLGSKLPPVATYYITYVALKFFVGYGLELSRLIPFIIFHIKRKFKCKTERELREAWSPGAFKYHKSIAQDLLILTISLCYATIAPMILFFAALYYGLGWLVMRNQVSSLFITFQNKDCLTILSFSRIRSFEGY
ncbi:hypothetical protein M758_5G188100 [Ceratodon purpureus]|nr:hypothetical protein M758_5G188100 [Ceratodon purpureus]